MDYTKCITADGKNYAAIEKIIAELATRDCKAAYEKYFKHRKHFDKKGNIVQFPGYTLGSDILEAVNIARDYLDNVIIEEEYKAYCLSYNLRK